MEINILHLIMLFLTVAASVGVIVRYKRNTPMNKMYFLFSMAGIVIYSGISTVYTDLCEEYFYPVLLFIIIFTLGYFLAFKYNFIFGRKKHRVNVAGESVTARIITDEVLIVCVVIFFSYYFIQFIYPTFRLGELFQISLSIENIFLKRAATRGNSLYQIFYYLNTGTFAFFLIYIYRRIKEGKIFVPIALIIMWVYMEFAIEGYISRGELVVYALFMLVLFTSRKEQYFRITKKAIIIAAGIVIVSIPFLVSFESIRKGISVSGLDYSTALKSLIESETTYGQYYDFCTTLTSFDFTLKYFIWLVVLPLPSVLFPFKSTLKLTNVFFSEALLGIEFGAENYSTVLPSLMGESLILYGDIFFFIHAFMVGFFLCKYSRMLEKNPELEVVNLYFAINCLLLGRGSTSSLFPPMINSMVIYLVVLEFLKRVKFDDYRF